MKKNIQRTLVVFIGIVVLFGGFLVSKTSTGLDQLSLGVETVHAQEDSYQFLAPIGGLGEEAEDGARTIDVSSEDSFPNYVQTIITLVIGFAIMAAIILLIAGGFQYMTTVKEDGKKGAKGMMSRALGGLVLALAAVVILQTINPNLVELNSVETVTTTGDQFADVDPTISSEFGGSVHPVDGNTHGNRYCFEIDGTYNWSQLIGYNPDQDRLICYRNKNDCIEGERTAASIEGIGGSGLVSSCQYYFKSSCYIYDSKDTETTADDEQLEGTNGIGAGEDKDAAKASCRQDAGKTMIQNYGSTAEEIAENFNKKYPQCSPAEVNDNWFEVVASKIKNAIVNVFNNDTGRCKWNYNVQDKPEPEAELPTNWNDQVWCSTSRPSIGANPVENKVCWNNKSTCEGYVGDCYNHPTNMVSGDNPSQDTDCTDCVFLDESKYKVRSGGICTPDTTDEFCRIKKTLSEKLESLDNQINLAPEPLRYVITEAFPPTVEHKSNCHYDGSCVDIGLRKSSEEIDATTGNTTNQYENYEAGTQAHADKINRFINLAESVGLSVTYEVGSSDLRQDLIELGVSASKIKDYGVAPHFSVYRTASDR